MRQKLGICSGILLLLCVMSACAVTESPFARTTSNIGSAYAAAATTLSYLHEGKITYAYAASSFINFQSELNGADQSLTTQNTVDTRTLHHLLALYTSAMRAIDAPCLSSTCDWQGQIEILNRASSAFTQAGSS